MNLDNVRESVLSSFFDSVRSCRSVRLSFLISYQISVEDSVQDYVWDSVDDSVRNFIRKQL
jgi:hypothetical protein